MDQIQSKRRSARFQDLTGKTFGRWKVVRLTRTGRTYYLCECLCGTQREVSAVNLKNGMSRSCGCLKETQDGLGNSRECGIWRQMIKRCHNEKHASYRNYGGRGIYVCRRWRDSFLDFLADIGESPSQKHTLDRIDNDRGYTCGRCNSCVAQGQPMNCRWATRAEQGCNKRTNSFVTFDGQTLILRDWAAITGINEATLLWRISAGWPLEKVFTEPVRTRKRRVTSVPASSTPE